MTISTMQTISETPAIGTGRAPDLFNQSPETRDKPAGEVGVRVNTELTIDPRFQAMIPPLSAVERSLLEESLVAYGCHSPIIVWKGVIIDGHNRYEICHRRNIEFTIKSIEFADDDAAAIWIIDNQTGRRNLADIDRIALQAERAKLVAKMGKVNQQTPTGGVTLAKLPKSLRQ